MPKTRTKRKKQSKSKSKPATESTAEQMDDDAEELDLVISEATEGEEENKDDVDIDLSSPDEAILRTQLKKELQRLQDEYKRQKQITAELEQKRTLATHTPVTTEPMPSIPSSRTESSTETTTPITEAGPPTVELAEYPEVFGSELNFDSDFLGSSAINKQVMESVANIENELMALKAQVASKVDRESLGDFEQLEQLNRKLENSIEQLTKQVSAFQKDVERTELKLNNVLLDLGFEESLDINKIPHKILVLVYETILNDIINRVRHIKGIHDTEETVNNIIENIRSHTSGGELFKYEHNKIRIPELHQYLAKKLISPKQIHITYTQILEKLLEYVPNYQPKNFKAIIKMQSQEYAISNVIKLDERVEEFVDQVTNLEKNLNKFMSKFKDTASNQQSLQDGLAKIDDLMAHFSSSIDELPKIIDERIEALLDKKLSEKLGGKTTETVDTSADIESTPDITSETEPEPQTKPDGFGSVTLGDDDDAEIKTVQPDKAVPTPDLAEEPEAETGLKPEAPEPPEEPKEEPSDEPTPEPPPPMEGVFKSITIGDEEEGMAEDDVGIGMVETGDDVKAESEEPSETPPSPPTEDEDVEAESTKNSFDIDTDTSETLAMTEADEDADIQAQFDKIMDADKVSMAVEEEAKEDFEGEDKIDEEEKEKVKEVKDKEKVKKREKPEKDRKEKKKSKKVKS